MKIEINNGSMKLTLENEQVLGFETLFKAYQLATGGNGEEVQDEKTVPEVEHGGLVKQASRQIEIPAVKDVSKSGIVPAKGDLVKCDVQCPMCGNTQIKKVMFGDYFTKCEGCGEKLHLKPANYAFGIPNEKGFYYIATEKQLSAQERYEQNHGGIGAEMFKKSDVEGVPDSTNTISEIVEYLDEKGIEHKGVTLKGKLLDLVKGGI